ncbi:ABC transporter substrate-binding protein [Tissierella praeacuta]|uniref:ABC transporter substrate-binding protein n=1 Tax=Tissierella praeacuta TaxID=43131 RepID=UPI0028B09ACE|nr:ABC transporter substrate-binding protein [Tissierella praeacuta]
MKKRIVSGLLVLLILISIVGCSKKEVMNSDVTKNNIDSDVKELDKLTVGYAPGLGNMLYFIADREGYFKDEGLDVELVAFTNSGDGLNALNAGKIDVGITFGTAAPLTFITQGMQFSLFGGFLAGGQPIFATPEVAKEYNDLSDFINKKVATPRLTTPDIVWRSTMFNEGIDIERDLELIEMKKPTDTIEAVKSGKADIGIGVGANYAIIEEAGLEVIEWSSNLWENHACCRSVAKTDFLNENQDIMKKFMKSIIRAEKTYNENPELAVKINEEYLDVDYNTSRKITLETNQIIEADPRRKGIIEMWNRMSDIGYLNQGDIDIEKHINTNVYLNALEEILQEYPNDEYFLSLKNRYKDYNID